ncbi:hypothetical protein RRG08_052410 [Elysia crispata]|uniref:Uncharacterized protein n=1 Tax=Elysia crispata TaxID=231223 RepID=A0AAE1B182_9GAST|nr:hypothetical protein RRG08_052410 [Elysia crispata]
MAEESRMNLAALQQRDPYITEIIDRAIKVTLYKFSRQQNKWSVTDIEGSLFVYRSPSPNISTLYLMVTVFTASSRSQAFRQAYITVVYCFVKRALPRCGQAVPQCIIAVWRKDRSFDITCPLLDKTLVDLRPVWLGSSFQISSRNLSPNSERLGIGTHGAKCEELSESFYHLATGSFIL